MSERVFVMGAGRAGVGLVRALRASGVEVVGLHGRRGAGGPDRVSAGDIPQAIREASIVLVTVRDGQLDEALHEVLRAPLAAGAVVLHASGSAEPVALADVRRAGHPAGTFHPLLSFADPDQAAAMLRGAWIGIDGDKMARACARRLAERLGAHVLEIPAGQKARYHAAAVIASNFPVVLLALGERVLRETGVGEREAAEALRPLFFASVDNLRRHPAASALPGPLVRGDVGTVRRNLAALAGDADAERVYRALSIVALDLARAAGAPAGALAELEELLRGGGK